MLEVALELTKQGNRIEAERLRNEAQTQRTISTLLMSEANNLERDRKSIRAQRPETANPNIPRQVRRHSETVPMRMGVTVRSGSRSYIGIFGGILPERACAFIQL